MCCNCEASTSALCPRGGAYRQWICSEFSCSRLWLYHGDWRVFTYSPWLPYNCKIQFQWLFLLYRWVAALFFVAVVIASIVTRSIGARWLLFISNWSVVVLATYFVWAAVTSTVKVLWVHGCLCDNSKIDPPEKYHDFDDVPPVPVCCVATCSFLCGGEGPSWYHKVQWVLFYIAVSATIVVMIVFWSFVYDGGSVDFVTVAVHGLNVVFAIADTFCSGTPMRILHFYFATIYGIVYIIFQRIYFAASGDPIYSVLDYSDNEGQATGYAIALVFAFLGGHLFYYFIYLLRVLIASALLKCRRGSDSFGEVELDKV